jgi:hypothetical protein
VRTLVRLVFALPLALCLPASVHAQEVAVPRLGDPVPGVNGLTYLDLARQLVPDIARAGDSYVGHKIADLRHIGGDEWAGEPPETIEMTDVAVLPVRSDGKDRLLLLFDLGDPGDVVGDDAVLALFNVAGPPTLVDAAEVGYDVHNGFDAPPRLSLGEGKDLVFTRSSHFNSNQAYVTTALILIRNDSLQLVDSIFTFHDRACSYVRDEVLDVRAGDRDGRTYSDIVVTVTETTELADPVCEGDQPPKPGTRTASATYRWDDAASRFIPDSDAIKKLEAENMERL